MLKIYALDLNSIQNSNNNAWIVAQVFLISSDWVFFFCISFRMSKFKTRIHSKSCAVRKALKKQHYNSGTICGGFFNSTPNQKWAIFAQF